MYSVLRLTSPDVIGLDDLDRIVEEVETDPQNPLRRRYRGDGFSAVLCDEPSWDRHATAIAEFLKANKDALSSQRSRGYVIAIDVAVEPEDGTAAFLQVLFPEELVAALSTVGARLVVTLYAPAPNTGVVADDTV